MQLKLARAHQHAPRTGMTLRRLVVVCTLALGMIATAATAGAVDTVYWADWTSATTGTSATAAGNIGTLTLGYAGEISPAAQVSGGLNFWIPNTPYLSGTVTNAPATSDIIRLTGLSATAPNQITFSEPVIDPIMAICSLGAPLKKVYYTFDAPFDVLSYGPGYWGAPGSLTELPGNVLEGWEGHGVIQFHGVFTSISWTASPSENWHGFTIGKLMTNTVGIDIKPGSDPNSINIDSSGRGVIPVAILGSDVLDVNLIDPLTVTLEGASVQLKGKSGNAGSYCDVNVDGYIDLVVHIADFSVSDGATTAKLTATTYGGQVLEGSDAIRLVPPTN